MPTIPDFADECEHMLQAWNIDDGWEAQQARAWEHGNRHHPRLSGSRRNTASSRMRNAANSTPSLLLTILDRLERSVSLDERITCLEDFISTLSLCLIESSPLGIAGPLTSQVTTQILSQATAHRSLGLTMQQRMATLSEEASSGRAEETVQFLELVESGMASSWRKLESNFLSYARTWTLELCVSTTPLSSRTPIGGIDWTALLTPIREVLSYAQTACLLSIDGHMKILATAKEVRNFHGWGKAPQWAEQSSAPRGR